MTKMTKIELARAGSDYSEEHRRQGWKAREAALIDAAKELGANYLYTYSPDNVTRRHVFERRAVDGLDGLRVYVGELMHEAA